MKEVPVACTLEGAALAQRQAELATGLFAQAVDVETLPDGYRWRFESSPGLLGRLVAVVEAERHCCRFLRFNLETAPDLGTVTLAVTGPAGSREFLEAWLPDARTHHTEAR
jgi:hypothetical protein